MKLSSENLLLNAIAFQGIWWATVLLRDAVTLPVAALIAIHIWALREQRLFELGFVISVGLSGWLVDSLFIFFDVFQIAGAATGSYSLPPLWLLTLWIAFSCTLRHSLRWTFSNKALAFFLGAIAGPLTYLGAANFGALEFSQVWGLGHILMGLYWGLLFVILSWFFSRQGRQ